MFRKARARKTGYAVLAVVFASLPVLAQAPAQATGPTNDEGGGRMVTPTPVSGEGYSLEFATETARTNYIRGGLTFSTAYDDGVTTDSNGHQVGDVSYSIWPTIALDQTRSRLNWDLSYSPGFTFYQKTTSLNQADQTADLNFHYRLTPHVTFNVLDDFRQTSNVLSASGQNPGGSVGGGLNPPTIVLAPVTDQIRNYGNLGITYQFAANGMVGASGFSSILQFPNLEPASGLYNSNTRRRGVLHASSFRQALFRSHIPLSELADHTRRLADQEQQRFPLLHSVPETDIVVLFLWRSRAFQHDHGHGAHGEPMVARVRRQPGLAVHTDHSGRQPAANHKFGERPCGRHPQQQCGSVIAGTIEPPRDRRACGRLFAK